MVRPEVDFDIENLREKGRPDIDTVCIYAVRPRLSKLKFQIDYN